MNKVLKYGAVLIGVYLGVYYYTGAGKLLSGGSSAAGNIITDFQGAGRRYP